MSCEVGILVNEELMDFIKSLYQQLFKQYGPQGWWPLLRLQSNQINPTNRGKFTGYHPNNYTIPESEIEIFEIILGAILTQNTSWTNAETALANLSKSTSLTPKELIAIPIETLALLIKSSGYFNQKSTRLHIIAEFFLNNPISNLVSLPVDEIRIQLLAIKGIGPETADSILLYALKKPSFVIDAYTRRLLSRMGIGDKSWKYQDYRMAFQSAISPTEENLRIYNEYHALIVQHCVHICKKTPLCEKCLFNTTCPKIIPKPKKKQTRKKNFKK